MPRSLPARLRSIELAGALVLAVSTGCSDAAARQVDGLDRPDAAADAIASPDVVDGSDSLRVLPLMYTPPEQPVRLLADGDPIEFYAAPQGGHVLMVGARVEGLDSDVIELRARLRDATTRVIVAEELRTVVMEAVAAEPSFKQTDRRTPSQVAHIAVCPDYEAADVVGVAHELEVSVTELHADFSTGTASVRVLPSCVQTDEHARAACQCECVANYTLGKCGISAGDDGPRGANTTNDE